MVIEALGAEAWNNKLFSFYHSSMPNEDLKDILTEFRKPDSNTRLLIATVAFGIGINIPDIKYVIHWGAATSVDEYWQEVGRAGRNGQPAHAIMYATPISLINADQAMKDICSNLNKCIRKQVLDCLAVTGDYQLSYEDPSTCCSSCKV